MSEDFDGSFEQILNDTVPQTPGIQRDVAMRELRLAMREFFERSWAWTVVIEDVDAPAGEEDITLDTSFDEGYQATAEVIGILNVAQTTGKGLQLLARRPNRTETGDDTNFWFVNVPPDTIRVWPYLQNAQSNYLDVTVALMPKLSGSSDILPDETMTKFYDAIINGYLARVYMHPNKPYSSPQSAIYLRHNFMRQIGYYMGLRKTGGTGGQGWTYPPSWGVRRLGGR